MIGFAPLSDLNQGGILFAEDFDLPEGYAHVLAPEEAAEPEIITPTYSAEELEVAREAGHTAGEAAGRRAAAASDMARTADALAAIAGGLAGARETAREAAQDLAEDITRLLLATLATLAPSVCAHHGEAEIAAVLAQVLPGLRTEPRITVRVNTALADSVRARLATLDPDTQARIDLQPTQLPPGDVQIAWRDGEAVRDTRVIWRGIAEVLTPLGLLALLPAAPSERITPECTTSECTQTEAKNAE